MSPRRYLAILAVTIAVSACGGVAGVGSTTTTIPPTTTAPSTTTTTAPPTTTTTAPPTTTTTAPPTTTTTAPPTTTTTPPTTTTTMDEEFHQDGLTCPTGWMNAAIYDYGSDAVPYETVDEAIDAFMQGNDWQRRTEWHGLTPGEMEDGEVGFSDDDGNVRLIVTLDEWHQGWLVGGYRACSSGPPEG